MLLLVNKNNIFNEALINDFEIVEYENYAERIEYVERDTLKHFEMLKAHLKVDGIEIDIKSAYRSLESQENLFIDYMKKYGLDQAEEMVKMPGTSEHHTGQAIDIAIKIAGTWISDKETLLKQDKIYKKIHHALKYFGFILRYPKGKESITGYPYEPWHIRYVTEEIAMQMDDITLEEYLNNMN